MNPTLKTLAILVPSVGLVALITFGIIFILKSSKERAAAAIVAEQRAADQATRDRVDAERRAKDRAVAAAQAELERKKKIEEEKKTPQVVLDAYQRLNDKDYAGAEYLVRRFPRGYAHDANYIMGLVYMEQPAAHDLSIREFTAYIENPTDDNDRGKGYKYRALAYSKKAAYFAQFQQLDDVLAAMQNSTDDLTRAKRYLTDQKEIAQVDNMLASARDTLKRLGGG
jgi:hypothetical protein